MHVTYNSNDNNKNIYLFVCCLIYFSNTSLVRSQMQRRSLCFVLFFFKHCVFAISFKPAALIFKNNDTEKFGIYPIPIIYKANMARINADINTFYMEKECVKKN